MPTERHTDPRSRRRSRARSAEPQRGSGTWRASCTPDCTRSSSRGGSPSAQAAGRAPSTPGRPRATTRPSAATCQRSALHRLREPGRGEASTSGDRAPGEVQRPEEATTTPAADADRRPRRAAVRRTPSTTQPTACPTAVAARTHVTTTTWAPSESFGRRDQGDDGQQAPYLDEPGEVERGEDEGAEVLGDAGSSGGSPPRSATAARGRRPRSWRTRSTAGARRQGHAEVALSRDQPSRRSPSSPLTGRAARARPRRRRSGRARPGSRATAAPRRRTVRARNAHQVRVSRAASSRRAARCQSRRAR